jgi:hypothetical protein
LKDPLEHDPSGTGTAKVGLISAKRLLMIDLIPHQHCECKPDIHLANRGLGAGKMDRLTGRKNRGGWIY